MCRVNYELIEVLVRPRGGHLARAPAPTAGGASVPRRVACGEVGAVGVGAAHRARVGGGSTAPLVHHGDAEAFVRRRNAGAARGGSGGGALWRARERAAPAQCAQLLPLPVFKRV